MSAQSNGGPAFPVLARLESPSHDYRATSAGGMTLRDYFAAKAMQGVLASNWTMSDIGYSMKDGKSIMENNAICAYEIADVMLAARGFK